MAHDPKLSKFISFQAKSCLNYGAVLSSLAHMYICYYIRVVGQFPEFKKLLEGISTELVPDMELWNKETLIFESKEKFSYYFNPDYEYPFVDFFKNNGQFLLDNGADEFDIDINLFKGPNDPCSIEVFDYDASKIFGKYKVSLPVSVFTVPEDDKNRIHYMKLAKDSLKP